MVDGWASFAVEIFRMVPLIIYHLKNVFLVKTRTDREDAMHPGSLLWPITKPCLQLYFCLDLYTLLLFIYSYRSSSSSLRLPTWFSVIRSSMCTTKSTSATSIWPDVHRRILIGLIISQFTLLGLLSIKEATNSTPFLLVLPVLTFWFHQYCNMFESAFRKLPLQDAMIKDTLERATELQLDRKEYLKDAYIHSIYKYTRGI